MTGASGVRRLPRAYRVWLGGALGSLLGDAVLYFALGWAAAAHGGAAAGLVLTSITLPRTALLLVGGALGDRLGARRVMIAGDVAMIAVALSLCLMVWRVGAPLWLLVATGLLIGVVDAFYLPASGSMPRRLVGTELLPKALALRQTGAQLVTMAGGALGGLLVAAGGLGAAAAFDAVTFAFMLGALMAIRPTRAEPRAPGSSGVLRDAGDGVRVAWRDPVLRAALALTACAAGALLPVVSLLVPLLARDRGWEAGTAGLVVGAQSLGIVCSAGWVARRGGARRPGLAAALGLLVAGCGAGALALAGSSPVAAGGAALLVGLGNGLFAAHLAPLVLASAPDTHLSRLQALMALVQSGALLLMNNVLGGLAQGAGPTAALGASAAILTVAALAALAHAPLRGHRGPESGDGLVRDPVLHAAAAPERTAGGA
ncbi:MFS transporter [Streptomyces radicis]|uniref:MFS transporter n=1 Tax=Streptomyces radicis TaxID=1750517 RepID=A0A3A9WH78_9ACTN|nr:MFS transporter [Streptomyces radicis]RKN07046.1 MFS transporter [Streptomyces radicis]RKN15107.1 MFS transporter [Streptomyces radicis]